MPIITVGIDLAKAVFAVHGVDEAGKSKLGEAQGCAGSTGAIDRPAAPVLDWYGGLLRRSSLGEGVRRAWPYGQVDGS
nr:hypothetical protein pPsy0479a_00085 [Pseudomonas syringae]